MKCFKVAALATCLVIGTGLAQAQMLTSRQSTLNYNALYGHGGDVVKTPSDSQVYSALVASDSKSMNLVDSQNGMYLLSSYSTSVNIHLNQAYHVTGPMSGFAQIDASVHSSFGAFASGAAGAGAGGQSTSPGNELLLDFTTAGFHYEFLGAASYLSSGPSIPHAKAELLRWNGSNWVFLESTIFSNNVVRTGTLTAGTYRLLVWGQTKSILNGTAFADTTLRFRNLDAVPEPASAAALGAGLMTIGFLRRRRK